MEPELSDVTATDGVRLAVQQHGAPGADRPTLVAMHGYPDDHTVWDGVVELLTERFHLVTYDVRGAGGSGAPRSRAGYRMGQLVADLGSVLDATAPGRRVHLLAHDWGSLQAWAAVTDPAYADRLASFTSISGPHLGMIGRWLRNLREHPRAGLKQLLASYYILGFQLPWLPERIIEAGVLDRLVAHSRGRRTDGSVAHPPPARRDAINGLELYRANMFGGSAELRPRPTDVPVQVLAPTDDPHVTVRLALDAPAAYCSDLTAREIPGNHWVIATDPDRIARLVIEFTSRHPG